MVKRVATLVAVLLLAACETPVSVPRYADITFAHRPPIDVDVAKVTVVEAYRGPGALPNVEREFPVPPMRMAARWAKDRLNPVGDSGELVFTIREAPVVEIELEKSTGLTGIVTVDQAERYEARLVVEMAASDPDAGRRADATTTVERSRTVAEDATLNERKEIWYQMVEDMAADLDGQLDAALRKYFHAFLR